MTSNAGGSGRQRVAYVAPEIVAGIVTQGWRGETVGGVPHGARFLRWFYDDHRDVLALVFEHESFDELNTGDDLPAIDIVVKREAK